MSVRHPALLFITHWLFGSFETVQLLVSLSLTECFPSRYKLCSLLLVSDLNFHFFCNLVFVLFDLQSLLEVIWKGIRHEKT